MPYRRLITVAVLALTFCAMAQERAEAGWSIDLRLGGPVRYRPRPYCAYPRFYPRYYYRPVYVRPAPVIVEQPVQVVQPVYQARPVVTPTTTRAPIAATADADVNFYLQKLSHFDERERREAVLQLGRLKARQATSTITVMLSNDRSPLVRESCARALGLIGASESLTALERAAQQDEDQLVRQSASYSAEIIKAHFSPQR